MIRPRNVGPALTVALSLTLCGVAWAHCEIPCGIYADRTRIELLREHARTIEKSAQQIAALAGKTDPQSLNQLVRWVENKDEHARQVQELVTQYFMTQRVKPPEGQDRAANQRYLVQLTTLHEMLITAMKAKQTVDPAQATRLLALTERFALAYLSAEDLEHLKEDHSKPEAPAAPQGGSGSGEQGR